MTPTPEELQERAQEYVLAIEKIVHAARNDGIVITVETLPNQPLAMGNHLTCIEARPGREVYAAWLENSDA